VRITSRTRRTAALMAASTIGLSTLVLGVTGVASASDVDDFTFSTDPGDGADQTIAQGDDLVIPAGYCSVDWYLLGAGGGDASDGSPGAEGDDVEVTTTLTGATTFTLYPGSAGEAGDTAGGPGGTNGNGDDGGDGVDDGNGVFGGGGGAASTVVEGGSDYLRVVGGAGGGDGGGLRGAISNLVPGATPAPAYWSDGVISGTVNACPASPTVNWVEGGDHSLLFQLEKADGATVTGTQYSLDGGSWTTVSTDNQGDFQYSGEITGLTTGHTYSVRFRFVTSDGNGQPSDATTAAPAGPAPTNVQATVAEGSIHITWAPPADPTGVVGYAAWALPGAQPQSDDGLVECPAMDASARECTIIVPAGRVYSVSVVALSPDRSLWATLVTDSVPAPSAPATVPTGSGPLSTPSGAISGLAQGSTVTLTGDGYAPNSTVSLYIYSTPTFLGTTTTNGSGAFSATVTIPSTLAPGSHHLVSAGLDPSGNPRYLTSAVTVAQATGTLAWTGFETLPVLGTGVLVVALGAGLIVVGRRRRTA
jgi:hypothetical protein